MTTYKVKYILLFTPNFDPKNGTVQLLIGIRMYTNVSFVFSVLFFVFFLCNINFLTDIEPTSKSSILTMMIFLYIKLLVCAILITSLLVFATISGLPTTIFVLTIHPENKIKYSFVFFKNKNPTGPKTMISPCTIGNTHISLLLIYALVNTHMSHVMELPTMWHVRPAKPQISQRIRAV